MHDWSLISVSVDWKNGSAVLKFEAYTGPQTILVQGLTELKIPRSHPWGPSVSVNKCVGPVALAEYTVRLSIEMQSGDVIEITAAQFEMPPT